MVAPVRLGIVGLGWVARDYMLPAIAAVGEQRVVLTAVAGPNEEDFRGLDERVRRFRSLDELLTAELVDAVYIATPNYLHREQAVSCLEAGLHVLCEKPLGLGSEEVRQMREAARRNDRLLVTAYDQRHHPAHAKMQMLLREGYCGTVTQARIDYACWLPAEWSPDNWRIDYGRAGGGAVIDLAPHGLDLLAWLLGEEISDLHCYLQRRVQRYAVDDGGVLSVRFANGTLASLTVGYNRSETLPRRRLEVIGTGGMLVAHNTMGQTPGGELQFVDAKTGVARSVPFAGEESPFTHQLTDFLRRIAAGGGSLDELDVTLHQVTLLEDALRLAESRVPQKT